MLKPTVRIHSGIFQKLKDSGKFYYYLRYLDPRGSGYADVEVYKCQKELGIGRSTFYKYANDKTYVREIIQIAPRTFRIYYTSVVKLASNFIIAGEIEGLGAACELYLEELQDWRETTTLAEAILLQSQSIYKVTWGGKSKANRGKKDVETKRRGRPKRPYLDIEKVFEEKENILTYKNRKKKEARMNKFVNGSGLPSYMSTLNKNLILKKVFNKNRVFVYFNTNAYVPVGGSQDTIAERMGLSVRTVQRRLKHVDKMQQCYTNPNLTEKYEMECFLEKEEWVTYTKKYFEVALATNKNLPDHKEKELFQSYTNLYNPNQVDLIGTKFLRRKIIYRLIWMLENLPKGIVLPKQVAKKIKAYKKKFDSLKEKDQLVLPYKPDSSYSCSYLEEKYSCLKKAEPVF